MGLDGATEVADQQQGNQAHRKRNTYSEGLHHTQRFSIIPGQKENAGSEAGENEQQVDDDKCFEHDRPGISSVSECPEYSRLSRLLQGYEFRPGLRGTFIALLGTGLFVALMLWQLGRADEKRQLQADFDARMKMPEINYKGGGLAIAGMQYRKVQLGGHFLKKAQVLLDNVVHDGKPGYAVITPFQLDSGEVLLVDRGWVAQGARREVLPDIAVDESPVRIMGWLDHHRSRPVISGGKVSPENNMRWLYIDITEYEKYSGLKVPDFVVHLAPDGPYGYVRAWPRYDANVGMHIGYAIQWGVFALIAAGTWLALSFRRRGVAEGL